MKKTFATLLLAVITLPLLFGPPPPANVAAYDGTRTSSTSLVPDDIVANDQTIGDAEFLIEGQTYTVALIGDYTGYGTVVTGGPIATMAIGDTFLATDHLLALTIAQSVELAYVPDRLANPTLNEFYTANPVPYWAITGHVPISPWTRNADPENTLFPTVVCGKNSYVSLDRAPDVALICGGGPTLTTQSVAIGDGNYVELTNNNFADITSLVPPSTCKADTIGSVVQLHLVDDGSPTSSKITASALILTPNCFDIFLDDGDTVEFTQVGVCGANAVFRMSDFTSGAIIGADGNGIYTSPSGSGALVGNITVTGGCNSLDFCSVSCFIVSSSGCLALNTTGCVQLTAGCSVSIGSNCGSGVTIFACSGGSAKLTANVCNVELEATTACGGENKLTLTSCGSMKFENNVVGCCGGFDFCSTTGSFDVTTPTANIGTCATSVFIEGAAYPPCGDGNGIYTSPSGSGSLAANALVCGAGFDFTISTTGDIKHTTCSSAGGSAINSMQAQCGGNILIKATDRCGVGGLITLESHGPTHLKTLRNQNCGCSGASLTLETENTFHCCSSTSADIFIIGGGAAANNCCGATTSNAGSIFLTAGTASSNSPCAPVLNHGTVTINGFGCDNVFIEGAAYPPADNCTSIYSADGTLLTARTVTMGANDLTFGTASGADTNFTVDLSGATTGLFSVTGGDCSTFTVGNSICGNTDNFSVADVGVCAGNIGTHTIGDANDNVNLLGVVQITGTTDLVHTAAGPDDHALEIDVFASGYGDVKAIDIVYTTGNLTAGSDEAVILVNIDESATGGDGDITALEVLTTTEGGSVVNAMLVGVGVNPIEQLSGVFEDASVNDNDGVDATASFILAGTDVAMFVADDDTVTVGLDTAMFEEIEFLLATTASQNGIVPTFEYSTHVDATPISTTVGHWTAFTPVDGTNGMRNSGVIAWLDADVVGWVKGNTSTDYMVRIKRTRPTLNTAPIESLVRVAAATQYEWNKDGDIIAKSFTGDGSGVAGEFLNSFGNYSTPPDTTVNQAITLTGDVAGSGTGSFAATIASDAVTYDKMQDATVTNIFIGRDTIGGGTLEEITAGAARTILNVEDGATAEVPASESVAGIIEIATQAEVDAGTDDVRAVTPLKLATYSGLGGGMAPTTYQINGTDTTCGSGWAVVNSVGGPQCGQFGIDYAVTSTGKYLVTLSGTLAQSGACATTDSLMGLRPTECGSSMYPTVSGVNGVICSGSNGSGLQRQPWHQQFETCLTVGGGGGTCGVYDFRGEFRGATTGCSNTTVHYLHLTIQRAH